MPSLEQDRALLEAFRDGRRDALLAVYQSYARKIASVLHAGLRRNGGAGPGPFDLENGVQEVFMRAFEPSARLAYDGIRPYEGFLVGIAKNLIHERAREREVPTAEPEQSAAPESAERSEEELESREVARLLAGFLDGCDPSERALYQARFEEARSQDDAARDLGLSRIQLRRRERKLKLKLLRYMQARGYLVGLRTRGWSFRRGAP